MIDGVHDMASRVGTHEVDPLIPSFLHLVAVSYWPRQEAHNYESGICTAFREHTTVTGRRRSPIADPPMVSSN